jgi:hypothetical protein
MARHPMETREPDEEWWLMEMSFESSMSSIKTHAPNHRRWIEGRSQRATYRFLFSLLQYLQWQDGGARGRPWILKSPAHLGELPLLFETFPDATVVHCHRHPREVIASFAALMEATWRRNSDTVDLDEIGHGFTAYWGRQTARGVEARRRMDRDRVIDVYFEDVCDRPQELIEEIYARAGRAVTPEARTAFDEYAARRPRGFFGNYTSDMSRYGITDREIETAFAAYLDYFPRLRAP